MVVTGQSNQNIPIAIRENCALNDRSIALVLVLLLDVLFGDPPNRYHPVAWMGSMIGWLQRRAPAAGHERQLTYGGLIASGGMTLAAGTGWMLERAIIYLPRPFNWLAAAVALKSTLSLRGLSQAAGDIYAAFEANDLPEARRLVSWHLVSRDTSTLDETQVVAATVESVAENTSDGIIAPLFYFAVLGLPGALAYRFANTADAMLGYRDAAREWLGKISARTDDLLNLIPARLTASALCIAAVLTGDDAQGALATWRRDRYKTDSPNAGHPMSAAAGALGVELEKVGHYRLGEGNRKPQAGDIPRAVHLMWAATLIISAGLIAFAPLIMRRKR